MKTILSAMILGFTFSASAVVLDGVPYNCLQQAKYELIRDFASSNVSKEEIEEFKKFVTEGFVSACRDRKKPNLESFTWGDGSGITWVSMDSKGGKCKLLNIDSAQDDQDYEDPEEYRKNCLTSSDFKNKSNK